jgi:hypothetical protein
MGLTELAELVVAIDVRQKTMAKQVSTIFRTLEGNGHPGLKQKMAVLESEHEKCMQDRATLPARQSNVIQWLMLGCMIVTCVVTIVINRGGSNENRTYQDGVEHSINVAQTDRTTN